ncbi:hypothetical protein P280DRAFT_68563 [Massarina eburnea CBS 473.64]|uniref:Uncharacterized protein n=1 Tax=Massarina eburnea CBS 473.64 TaxID=1395130 RepID=A0A6A6RYE0_9PLEO|nr:hypothetical protein P280DRAFT_68563 [Massarina eburnea CBS 473.64]
MLNHLLMDGRRCDVSPDRSAMAVLGMEAGPTQTGRLWSLVHTSAPSVSPLVRRRQSPRRRPPADVALPGVWRSDDAMRSSPQPRLRTGALRESARGQGLGDRGHRKTTAASGAGGELVHQPFICPALPSCCFWSVYTLATQQSGTHGRWHRASASSSNTAALCILSIPKAPSTLPLTSRDLPPRISRARPVLLDAGLPSRETSSKLG